MVFSKHDVAPEVHCSNMLEYTVAPCDTVTSIAAQFDCTPSELCSLNRLLSRTVFEGMIVKIPIRGSAAETSTLLNSEVKLDTTAASSLNVGNSCVPDNVHHVGCRQTTKSREYHEVERSTASKHSRDKRDIREASFVKMNVKYITAGEGFINGTLLVTSNSLMFDPNVSDSLVKEHGVDRFVIHTPLENILSLAIYRDPQIILLSAEKRKEESNKQLYYPTLLSTIYESLALNEEVNEATTNSVDKTGSDASTTNSVDKIIGSAAATTNTVDNIGSAASTTNSVEEITVSAAAATSSVDKVPSTAIKYSTLLTNNELSELKKNADITSSEKKKVIKNSSESNVSRRRCKMACAFKPEDHPILQSESWKDFAPCSTTHFVKEPLYLCVCLSARRRASLLASALKKSSGRSTDADDDYCEAHCTKSEYWFSIPHEQADLLHTFLVDYGVNLYANEDAHAAMDFETRAGFVMFNSEAVRQDHHLSHTNSMKRCDSWEMINKEDFALSWSFGISDPFLALPAMFGESRLLVESRIRRLLQELPARAEGHSWHLMYSTEEHGFSLNSLYRRSIDLDAACLLILKDNFGSFFGVVSSCPFKLCEHFYGTGETFLFRWLGPAEKEIFEKYSWSSKNDFIMKGDLKSLSIGCSQGSNGLWLDDNLYHGRSQACDTFCNPSLTLQEDFIVCELEVWAFAD